jgi:mannan endo-1,4-beta-mannosidase
VEKAIEWNGLRGIVTFAWHWNAPKDLIDQPGKEWWRGFYTDATTFDVSKAMNDNSSEEYTLILRDIDAIAVQLKRLKDANVPVLWRPLHEAEGTWFWWGAKGPEPCKWLWELVYDRLTNYHELNNLIWVWTSSASSAALDWYPGDEYVDIIGADVYLPAGTYSSNFIMFDNLVDIFEGKKIITLSENGPIPDAESLFEERAAWSWFCTWSGDFITDGVSNSTPHINAVYNHEYVISLDELDNVDNIIAALEAKRNQDDEEIILGTEEIGPSVVSYENPIRNSHLTLRMKGTHPVSSIVVYNVQGQIQFIEENRNGDREQFEFDFKDNSSGIYIVKVRTSSFTKILRIVKL